MLVSLIQVLSIYFPFNNTTAKSSAATVKFIAYEVLVSCKTLYKEDLFSISTSIVYRKKSAGKPAAGRFLTGRDDWI